MRRTFGSWPGHPERGSCPPSAGRPARRGAASAADSPARPAVRSGGTRQHRFAPRARRGDPRVDLNFALDLDGFQERTLKLAYTLYESSRKRLEICARRRATGVDHANLPLRPVKARPCGPTACNCTIDYRHLTAPNMMGIDASIVRATPQPAPHARPPPPTPAPCRPLAAPPRYHRRDANHGGGDGEAQAGGGSLSCRTAPFFVFSFVMVVRDKAVFPARVRRLIYKMK